MRFRGAALMVIGALALNPVLHAQQYNVRTMAAPNSDVTKLRSFHLLPTPLRRDGARRSGAYDPMVNNSIANRALRASVSGELETLGYHQAEWIPDFVVAIYATTHERLDLGMWAYDYHHSPPWWPVSTPGETSTTYPEGTVVVDIISPVTLDVLWRGTARIAVEHDPLENAKELVNAAGAIVDRLSRAKPIIVACTVSAVKEVESCTVANSANAGPARRSR